MVKPSLCLRLCCCFCSLFFLQGFLTVQSFTGTYGINYGRIADNIPSPEDVVILLKAAKIKNVKIFDSDHNVLNAFRGSGLELVIGLPNGFVKNISSNGEAAIDWVKANVLQFIPDTHIRGIAVGNEILGANDQQLAEALLGAIRNIYRALKRLQLHELIEVYTPHSQAVFNNSYPPSSCTFSDNVIQYMLPILDFFSKTGAPFFLNIYPFIAYKSDPDNINMNYALFQPNPGVYDVKTNLYYDNMFDAVIDAAYAALQAAGYGNMEVQISETGWASDGDQNEAGATVQNARTYNFNLRKRLFKKRGTPLRPKPNIKAYIFALFNEDLKPGAGSEQHYGLFNPDGSISYDIGFHGSRNSATTSSFLSLKGIQVTIVAVLISCSTTLLLFFTR